MPHRFEDARYERLMSAERRRRLPPESILHDIGLKPGQTFVDIGSGPGYFALPAARIVGRSGRVFGLDVSPFMLGHLRRLAAREKAPQVRVRKIPEAGVSFPSGADYYFLANVFHEIEDKAAYLRDLRTAMAVCSRLVIIDFFRKKTIGGPPLRDRIPLRTLRTLLADTGFAVERVFRPNEDEYGVIARRRPGARP